MSFTSIRIVTEDVDRLVEFYELVTGDHATRPAPVFAQFDGPGGILAIASPATVAMLGDAIVTGTNRSIFIEFEVDDVEAEFGRLQGQLQDVVLPPTTMPWGNRSTLFRDPDGNLVNLFSRPTS